MSRAGEFDWIAQYLAPLAGETSFGLQDDAALLKVPDGCELVVTQDAIAEGIHFLSGDPLETVAQKVLRVNVSDIVAKGATPFAYSLALGVPDQWDDSHIAEFCGGLRLDQQKYDLQLNGGDTYRSPDRLCIAVTMFGNIPNGKYVSRLNAKPDDVLFVTGTIGAAALGLQVANGHLNLDAEAQAFLLSSYRLPNPPMGIQNAIAEFASASMDISDGLLGDSRKMCSASGVSAEIALENVPTSAAVALALQMDDTLWQLVWGGGDDYQCLCAIPPEHVPGFSQAADVAGISVSQIGKITDGEAASLSITREGMPVLPEIESFSHF